MDWRIGLLIKWAILSVLGTGVGLLVGSDLTTALIFGIGFSTLSPFLDIVERNKREDQK